MIAQAEFPTPKYQQTGTECIPASVGTAAFPFAQQNVALVVQSMLAWWQHANGTSGYAQVLDLLSRCSDAPIQSIASAVTTERRNGLVGLENILLTERASAVVALSFPNGRDPHSVCVFHDGQRFVLLDSSLGGSSDEVGGSLADVLAFVTTAGIAGDVIVFRAV